MSRAVATYPERVLLLLHEEKGEDPMRITCREVLLDSDKELSSTESINIIKRAFGYKKEDKLVRIYYYWTSHVRNMEGRFRGTEERKVEYMDKSMEMDLRCRPQDAFAPYGSTSNMLQTRLFSNQLFVKFQKSRNYREHE